MNATTYEAPKFQGRQQNTNKSLTAVLDLLHKCPSADYDVISIQEPYVDFLRNTRENNKWITVYPKSYYIDKTKRTRAMILISKGIAMDKWEVVDVNSPNVTRIRIRTESAQVATYNMY